MNLRRLVAATAVAVLAAACGGVGAAPRLARRDTYAKGIPVAIAFWDAHDGLIGGRPASLGVRSHRCTSACAGAVGTTSDGGTRWRVTLRTPEPIHSIDVAPGTTSAWVTAARCSPATCRTSIYQTDDLGRTWRALPAWPVRDPVFASDLVAWGLPRTTGAPRTFEVTLDGGATWRPARAPCRSQLPRLSVLAPITPRRGWVVCTHPGIPEPGLFETDTGGETWRLAARLPPIRVGDATGAPAPGSGLSVVPGGPAWLWGPPGRLYRSPGGGVWRPAPPVNRPGLVTRAASRSSWSRR